MIQEKEFDFNGQIALLTALLEQEREAGSTTIDLEMLERRRGRQADIQRLWEQLQQPWLRLKQRVNGVPMLPPAEQIAWTQSVRAMPAATLMEIDTTGTENDADLIRFTLADMHGTVFYDQLIKPGQAQLSAEASQRNGLTVADLADAPLLQDAWPHLCQAVVGRYIVAFGQEWDTTMLTAIAKRYGLPQIVVIGEDLQRRCTAYYAKEYYLSLEKVATRMGHSLHSYDAPARLRAQAAIVAGMAQGIMAVGSHDDTVAQSASDAHDDELAGLDEHPF